MRRETRGRWKRHKEVEPRPRTIAINDGGRRHHQGRPKHRRRREGGGQEVTERENQPRWRISLAKQWKMFKTPPPPGRRGRRRDAAAGKEGTRSSGATKPTAAGDVAGLLEEITEKNRSIRGFRVSLQAIVHIQFLSGVRPGLSVPLATRDLGSKPHCTSAQPFRL